MRYTCIYVFFSWPVLEDEFGEIWGERSGQVGSICLVFFSSDGIFFRRFTEIGQLFVHSHVSKGSKHGSRIEVPIITRYYKRMGDFQWFIASTVIKDFRYGWITLPHLPSSTRYLTIDDHCTYPPGIKHGTWKSTDSITGGYLFRTSFSGLETPPNRKRRISSS